jgi:pimeloyl-ACP methyl ester carboxylesterase
MLEPCTALLHGHSVSYHRAGEGSVLVLLHGIGSSSLTWEPVASALADRHDVIAPDFLGHGASAKPRGDYSLGAFASGIRDLLQLIGVERATIVGHSLGGGVAMQLAYQHPELCERLVLVSSGGLGHSVSPLLRAAALPGSEWVLPVIAGAAGGVGAKVGGVLAKVGLRVGNDMAEVGRGMADLGDREARLAFLDTLRAVVGPGGQRVSALDRLYLAADLPLLIVWGERDPIIPVGHGRRAHAAVPGSEMIEIEGAGHFPQLDDPAGFVAAVGRFVANTEPWVYDPAGVRELMLAGAGGQ